ncbi:MAG TPA: hypothetical protein DEF42_16760 [Desulfosporosinus sp.]|nr:hypothetical protein [Desulfosporosinus sp.]
MSISIGLVISLINLAICLLVIIVILKKYRPSSKITRHLGLFLTITVIAAMAFTQTAFSYQDNLGTPLDNKIISLYKEASWIATEDPEFVMTEAKKIWAENPDSDAKYLLALSYLKGRLPSMALPLLKEVQQTGSSDYVNKDILTKLINEVEGKENDQVKPIVSESESYIMDLMNDATKPFLDKAGKKLDVEKKDLPTLVKLDCDRINYLLKDPIKNTSQLSDVQELYSETRNNPVSDSVSNALANLAIHEGDNKRAEKILIEVLKQSPDNADAAVLLADLYLNRDVEPDSAIQQLPVYSKAIKDAQVRKREDVLLWIKKIHSSSEDLKNTAQKQFERVSQEEFSLNKQLAYEILKYLQNNTNRPPQIDVLLAKYYFLTGDKVKAGEQVGNLLNHPVNLNPEQLYYIDGLRNLPDDQSHLTTEELLEKNQLTQDLAQSLQPFHSSKPTEVMEENLEERSFSVFLSNQVINLTKTRIHITSLQPQANGEVTVYLQAENLDDLNKRKIKLMDNKTEITDFTVEKLSESKEMQRSIGMIVDKSGSMEGERINVAKMAVEEFIKQINKMEKVELMTFSSDHRIIQGLTDDKASLIASIRGVVAGGGTNIAPAFMAEINSLGQNTGERVIFILSDGEDEKFSDVNVRREIIDKANQEGITIVSIGFASGFVTLRDVSEATGGQYIPATSFETMFKAFDEIRETLNKTYKIAYKLDRMTPGNHLVHMLYDDSLYSSKSYLFSRDDEGLIDYLVQEMSKDVFRIDDATPNQITPSKAGTTTVELRGRGFEQAENLLFDGKKLEFKRKSDSEISFTINNNLRTGVYPVKLLSKTLEEADYSISVTHPGLRQRLNFGWATLYGDFIKQVDDKTIIKGNPSIDEFVFPQSEMVLSQDSELDFKGLRVKVIGTMIHLNNSSFTMSAEDHKTFPLKNKDNNLEFNFDRLGLCFKLGDLTYDAESSDNKPGSLNSEAAFKGFGSIKGLVNKEKLKKLPKILQFAPTADAEGSITYKSGGIDIKGEVEISLDAGLIKTADDCEFKLGMEYNYGENRFVLSGKPPEIKFISQRLKVPGSADMKIIWQNSFIPVGIGVTIKLDKGYPLASTGLTVNKFGGMLDLSSHYTGELALGLGTVADVVKPAIDRLRSIKYIGKYINPEISLLQIDGKLAVKNFVSADWSVNGEVTAAVLGFESLKSDFLISRLELCYGVKFDNVTLKGEGRVSVQFPNPEYGFNHIVLGTKESVSFIDERFANGEITTRLVPNDSRYNLIEFKGKLIGGKEEVYSFGGTNKEMDIII